MKSKKILACLLAGTMALSLAACGNETEQTGTNPTESVETTPATDVTPVAEDASIDFEDGNMGFIAAYMQAADAAELEMSVVDFGGSKALQVKNLTGKVPYVAIDVTSLLGAEVANVASVELSLGISYDDGTFNAVSGNLIAWSGADLVETTDSWSVYLDTANPKKAVATLAAGEEFVADAGNIMMVQLKTDNGAIEGHGNATLYIDNIRFLDASGNLLTADSSVAFVAPTGFEKTGHDTNLLYVDNEVELEGFATSAAGWAQAGIDLTDEQRALLVPGSVITINYKSDAPVWLVAVASDANPNPLGNWLRGIDQNTFITDGYVATDSSTVQYTYEQLVPYFGEDFGQFVNTLQCESSADWEVYSVTVGTKSNYVTLGSKTELEGFATSAAGWAQAGIDLTDEQRALIGPGCVFEISYKSDAPVWFIAVASDANPNPLGNWLRGVNQETFIVDGAVSPDGTSVQYTYEQLVPYFGEGFEQYLNTLQCESSADWEVFSVSIGKPFKQVKNATELEGFATSAAGWTQAGIDLTDEQRALLVPGSVITINYKSDAPVWLVAVASDANPNPLGNWLRGVNQETFIVDGAVSAEGGCVQYTYEQLVAYFGENFGQYVNTLQCESSADWEVYSVTVGMAE